MSAKDAILKKLDSLEIPYDIVSHEPVHTIGDCRPAEEALGAVVPRNLFLTPRNQSAFYLCLAYPDALFRTAELSRQIPSSRLSFAPDEKLDELLQTYAGAVSPLGLLFDAEKRVRLLIDGALLSLPRLAFHPNDNRFTLAMATEDFIGRFLPAAEHGFAAVALPRQS